MKELIKDILQLEKEIGEKKIISDTPETLLETRVQCALIKKGDPEKIFDLWENCKDRKSFNALFKILTNGTFRSFLTECQKVMEKNLKPAGDANTSEGEPVQPSPGTMLMVIKNNE